MLRLAAPRLPMNDEAARPTAIRPNIEAVRRVSDRRNMEQRFEFDRMETCIASLARKVDALRALNASVAENEDE